MTTLVLMQGGCSTPSGPKRSSRKAPRNDFDLSDLIRSERSAISALGMRLSRIGAECFELFDALESSESSEDVTELQGRVIMSIRRNHRALSEFIEDFGLKPMPGTQMRHTPWRVRILEKRMHMGEVEP